MQNALRTDVVELPTPVLDTLRANLSRKVVVSFDNIKEQPGKIVVIRPINAGDKQQNKFYLGARNYYDPEENIYYGFPMGVDTKTGDYKWLQNKIDGELVLDLGRKDCMRVYQFWINSPYFKGSKLQKLSGQTPILMCYDEEEETEMIFSRNMTKHQLRDAIANMKDESIKLYGLVFNIDPEKNSIVRIKNILNERIEKDPEAFKKIHEDQTRLIIRAVLNSSILQGIVRDEEGVGIVFNGKPIGNNRPAAENFLESNPNTFNEIYGLSKKHKRVQFNETEITLGEKGKASEEVKILKSQISEYQSKVNSLEGKLDKVLELMSKVKTTPKAVKPSEDLQAPKADNAEKEEGDPFAVKP